MDSSDLISLPAPSTPQAGVYQIIITLNRRIPSSCTISIGTTRRHPAYWWTHGVTIRVGDTLFKVPIDELRRVSNVFRNKLDEHGGDTPALIEVDNLSPESFQRILKIIHPRWVDELRIQEFESFGPADWADVLETASTSALDMPFIRNLAGAKLEVYRDDPSISPLVKYRLGLQYPTLLKSWTRVAFVDFCGRNAFLTEDEARVFTTDHMLKYARIRQEMALQILIDPAGGTEPYPNGILNSPRNIKVNRIFKIIKDFGQINIPELLGYEDCS